LLHTNCGQPFGHKKERERIPEIRNREAEVPKADQMFHSTPKDHSHMQHPQEVVPIVYDFSQAAEDICIHWMTT